MDKALTKRSEGLRLKRYLCPAGFWTIGYGHRCSADQPPITEEEADRLLELDWAIAARAAYALCPKLRLATKVRQEAIIDFVLNLGAGRLKVSTLRKKVNEENWHAAAKEMRKWVWGGGKKLPGLIIRREIGAGMLERG